MKTKFTTFISSSLKSLFLFGSLFFFHSLQAVVINFTGATNNDWATGSNWSTGSAPTASDVAYINASKTVTISAATTVTVQRVEMASASSLVNNGTLTITPTSETGSALYLSGSNTFTNSGTLTLNNTSQATANVVVNCNGIENLMTFNGTNNISSVTSKNLFAVSASASAMISGNGFTIGNSTTGALYSIFNLTAAGCSLTIDSGTTLNLYVDYTTVYGNGFYMSNSSSATNNGTINVFKGTNGNGRAIIIYNTVNSSTATFTNNGTFNITGLSAPIIYSGTAGTSRNGTLKNTGTLSIQTNVTTAINMSSANITSTLTNSGTITINSNTTAIQLPASASGIYQNTGTITITKGNIYSGATAGSFPTLNNNSNGVMNFNYGVAAGTTAATSNVIVSNNSGATINGSCTFAANTLVTAAGSTLSPGDYSNGASGYGIILLTPPASGTKFPLNGNVLMQIKGKTGEGTNFDRIKCDEINVTGASLTVDVSYASYTPELNDYISLIYAATSKTNPFSSTSMPRGWISSPNALNEAAKYYPSLPGAPTAVVATAGNAKASVAFTAPASDGGADITSYTVTSSPGSFTATGAASPLTVTGLTNETAYTFTVTATNVRGTGSASTASSSVTPSATANIIPVSSSTNISALTLTPVSDVVVNDEALLTINQATTINSLTVAAGGQVTNTSTLTTPTLTLNSDATHGTGTYINNGTSDITTLNANQYLGTTRNWYVSSPVQSTASSTTNILRYYEYVEAGNNADLTVSGSSLFWKGYNPGHTMVAGKGYIALPSAPSVAISFSGTMNTGNVSIPLTNTSTGFNLIGNPYPCHLTWTQAFATANSSKIYPTIWVRTNSGSSNTGGWSFNTYNALVGESVPSWADVVIAPMQAFWVKAKVAETLVLNSDLTKSHNTSNRLKAPAVKNANRQRIRLQVSNGITTDEALIYFDASASNTYDDYDSQKYPESASATQIYSKVGSENLVINGMNAIVLDTPIPVGFVAGDATAFSLKANEISNIPVGIKVILRDNATQAETDLTDGTATYNFLPATTSAERFSLIFRSARVSTNIENINKPDAQVYVNAANQINIVAPQKSNYAIYNAVGQLIENGVLNTERETRNSKRIAAGVYMVKVNNVSNRVVIK